MPLLILVLSLAVFAQGTSEFMLAGLLLPISAELGVTPAVAGTLTSAFAVGMVIGAPAMALIGARWSPRRALIALLSLFLLSHVVGAVTPTFEVLLITRVISALANAGFLAVALATVGRLVLPDRTTRAVATLLAGTTLATIIGVPAGALLATLLGWRATFWGVVLLCIPALIALLRDRSLRQAAAAPGIRIRDELSELRRRPVLGSVVLAVLVNSATFGVFTFLGVLGADAGIQAPLIPLLLAGFGVGAFAGVTATGRWAPGRERAWITAGTAMLMCAWAAFALLVASPIALPLLAVLCGALSFAVGSALIGRIVREAGGAPVLGGAYATVALNLGAFSGPLIAGIVYERSEAAAVPWTAVIITATAVMITVWALAPALNQTRSGR
ncbi:MFS transporter [Microbacterium sp.]|uniref:MFS transporter n=1 Tax=Microbacterium sp. TaxID=51671 RepID=UPI0028124B67|nr:MFS transporter [Microbacterium sp.]